MYRFLQFRADKGDAWRMYTPEQIASGDLPGKPTFQTVLLIDQDPEQVIENELDPLDNVHYLGPMYLDFDDKEDIDNVLEEVRAVLDFLIKKLDIPEEYIHCWLSGGKGVHITVPEVIFGLKKEQKFLPMIYKEIMLTIMSQSGLESPCTMDESVYSCGRGRMWRTEGMPRPGSGTFKIGTTPAELRLMDADEYHSLVASARPNIATPYPPKNVTFPKAEAQFKAAKLTATRKVRALKDAVTVPTEILREWDGIPGCVHKLITDGDCDGSNWNQAAMQLATYISARYEQGEAEEYMEQLVKPFTINVESSSRPTSSERLKQMKIMLNRAFRGSIKFAPGAFISAIGTRCGACPVCRSDLAKGETSQEDADNGTFDPSMKIKYDTTGYYLVADNGSRRLTNFTFWPVQEIFELETTTLQDGRPGWKHSERKEMCGTMLIEDGEVHHDVTINERSWSSKRDMIQAFKGRNAAILGGDGEAQKLLLSVLRFARQRAEDKELEKMVRTNVCGVVLDDTGNKPVWHYVESGRAITNLGGRSPYRYNGSSPSPMLINESNPFKDDEDLGIAIAALCRVNEPVQVALILGWVVACHFREHIQSEEPQFPLLNVYGNAGAGKSCLVMLFCKLGGINYARAEHINAEVATVYPLIKYVCSSTTVPRFVDEVNPATMGPTKYNAVYAILKAAWSRAPIQRGRIGGDKEMSVTDDRVTSPIVYCSEQSSPVPSLRSRSVEVRLQARTLLNPDHKSAYKTAVAKSDSLYRMAKALVTVALGTSPNKLLEIFNSKDYLVHDGLEERQRWGMKTCLTGLHMLLHTMEEFGVGSQKDVQALYDGLVNYLGGKVVEVDRGKSSSEVDKVISAFNTQADDTFQDQYRLDAGKHYWRAGDSIYLVLQRCMPKYLQYAKTSGELIAMRQYRQMVELLTGEVYFLRTEPHPQTPAVDVFVLSASKLEERGTMTNNFLESECE